MGRQELKLQESTEHVERSRFLKFQRVSAPADTAANASGGTKFFQGKFCAFFAVFVIVSHLRQGWLAQRMPWGDVTLRLGSDQMPGLGDQVAAKQRARQAQQIPERAQKVVFNG